MDADPSRADASSRRWRRGAALTRVMDRSILGGWRCSQTRTPSRSARWASRLVPSACADRGRGGSFQRRFNFARVLWHELAHSYALALSDARVPRWFTEGLASGRRARSAWDASAAARFRRGRARSTSRSVSSVRCSAPCEGAATDHLRASHPRGGVPDGAHPTSSARRVAAGRIHGADPQAALAGSNPLAARAGVRAYARDAASAGWRDWHPGRLHRRATRRGQLRTDVEASDRCRG